MTEIPRKWPEETPSIKNDLAKLRTSTENQITNVGTMEQLFNDKIALLEQNKDTPERLLGSKKFVLEFLDLLSQQETLLKNPESHKKIAEKIGQLLQTIASNPALSEDREWMTEVRNKIRAFIFDKDLLKKIEWYGTMDDAMREKLQLELWIPDITKWLDENTRDIIQKVHTGFYQFDAEVNTWVNSLWAQVFLWPENIVGIKKYLSAQNPSHPFLSVTDYRSYDREGKYAFNGKWGHNMLLAEADYLQQYISLQYRDGQKRNHEDVVNELRGNHAVVKWAQAPVDAFEKKYREGARLSLRPEVVDAQSTKKRQDIVSQRLVGEYDHVSKFIAAEMTGNEKEKYRKVFSERPEMKDIIYDLASGFLSYHKQNHVWTTKSGHEIHFNQQEESIIRSLLPRINPQHILITQPNQYPWPKTNEERNSWEYTSEVTEYRLQFYQR